MCRVSLLRFATTRAGCENLEILEIHRNPCYKGKCIVDLGGRAAPGLSVAATVHSATSTSTVLPPCQQSIQSPFATVAMPLPSPMPVTYPVIPVTTTSQVSQTAVFTTSSNHTVPVLSASSAVLGNSLSQEPHDITLANTLFEQAPSQILSVHSDIGHHVPHNNKENIQRSEYIDLCTLLSNNPNKKKTQKLSLESGQLVLQQDKNSFKITSIDQWTNAFIVFTSIFCSAHPSRFQELLKYLSNIRLGSQRFQGIGWKLL